MVGLAATAAVVVLALVVAVVVFVIPALRPSVPTDSTNVTDISSEPHTTWTYDWAADGEFLNDTPVIVSVGAGQALVWAQFDYSAFLESQGESAGWYPGYDTSYNAGFDSGTEYGRAVEAYNNDKYPYTVPAPDIHVFLPASSDDGYRDGFGDASTGADRGTSQKKQPDPPNFTPTVALVSAADGDELWSVDLSSIVDGVDYTSTYTAHNVPGSNAVAIVLAIPTGESARYVLVALDRNTGELLSELDSDGPIDVAALGGDIVAAAVDSAGTTTTVARYAVGDLGGKPKWKAQVDGAAFVYPAEGSIVAFSDDRGEALDGETGAKRAWGKDADFETTYRTVGGALVRVQGSKKGGSYDIQGWGQDGKPTWKHAIHTDFYEIRDDALFTASSSGSAYSTLQRIDPASGTPMWTKAYAKPFDGVLGIEGSRLLLASGTKVIVVDAGTGAAQFSQKVGEFYNMYFGSALYYVPSTHALTAYNYDKTGPAWSFDLAEGQTITTIGTHLVVVDADSGTVRGLEP